MFASSAVFTIVRLALKVPWGRAYAQVSRPRVSGPGVSGRRGYAQWLRAAASGTVALSAAKC